MTQRFDLQSTGRKQPGRSAVVFLLVWFTLRLAAPASADEWDTSAYKGWEVSKVTVRGLDDEMTKKLVNGLALALRTGFLSLGRPMFFPQTLDDDIRRTRLFMLQHGYPYADVQPHFNPDPENKTLEVIFDIDKGPPVIVSSVTTPGIPPNLEQKAGEVMSVSAGSVFTDADARETLESMKTLLEESGHARATADVRVTWEDSTHVGVVFEVDAGPVYYFGDVTVSGASDDLAPVAERTARIRRGRRYEPKLVDNAEQNLRLLGLFRQIRTQLVDSAPDTLDVRVEVTMREPYEIQTGVRYWTDAKLDAGVLWTGRNLLKRGRGVSALASASSVLQRAELSTWWPAVLAARSRLSLTLGVRNETEQAYRSLEIGGEIALGYDFTMETRIRLAMAFSNVRITGRVDDPALVDTNNGVLNEYSAYGERDMRDDLI
ncbi:MAG: BamA/TamA family outer membrane protein, partial [bacterium]